MRGQAALTPPIPDENFSHGFPSTAMIHGARVDETPSARGSIAIESRKRGIGFPMKNGFPEE